ncbi:hypothetical protein SAY86_029577 [Trapa natans]|uniref:Uncharacterized protein n=1 Tax=Trapa natans TaxID=22666 RepID=A0AAN7RG86_TRANT|nr:hypothetical protein SAY86_029577 [Trapa natans]
MAQGRSSQYTKVGAAMTNEKQLITVSSDTNILQAMQQSGQACSSNKQEDVSMISMVDVGRAVVEQQSG